MNANKEHDPKDEKNNKQRKTRRLDLTGQRFGMLTALNPGTPMGSGKTTWVCQCDCGITCVVQTKMLRNGKTTHCGCQKNTNRGIRKLHFLEGTCIELISTTAVRKNSKSGHTGVFYDAATGKWRAEIMLQGKRRYLGRFTTMEDAIKARKKAKEELHGEFLKKYDAGGESEGSNKICFKGKNTKWDDIVF